MTSSLLRAFSLLIEGSSLPVHKTLYPFSWITTLHAARISLAFNAKCKAEAEAGNTKKLNFMADIVGYLVMAWSGSMLIASILQEPYSQLLSVWPLVNYVSVHLLLRALPAPSAKVVDLSFPVIDGLLRSGALTGAVLGCNQHPDYKHSLFAQLVFGTLAPSAGSLTASTLGVTNPHGWKFSTPYPLLSGMGWIGNLELWIATISTVMFGILTHSHSDYDVFSDSPTHTHLGARSVVMLILASAYLFKAVYVHIYSKPQQKTNTKSRKGKKE